MHAVDANTGDDLWVFGYGSLMWRPGFDFIERVPARLIGLHRALCVYSFVHRGTPERPGLVLGLDRGGMCRGIAFRVAAAARAATVAYLRSREQVTTVYLETVRRIELEEEAKRQVRALCFIVDRSHVQYAGRLTLDECLHHVRQGHGSSGANGGRFLRPSRLSSCLRSRGFGCGIMPPPSPIVRWPAGWNAKRLPAESIRAARNPLADFRFASKPSASMPLHRLEADNRFALSKREPSALPRRFGTQRGWWAKSAAQ